MEEVNGLRHVGSIKCKYEIMPEETRVRHVRSLGHIMRKRAVSKVVKKILSKDNIIAPTVMQVRSGRGVNVRGLRLKQVK